MARHFDLLIRNATVVYHGGRAVMDVAALSGKTAAMGNLSDASADETIDAAGLHLLPGVIDTQVHFREPGNVHKEDLESGSRAAVLGGVTAVFEMPNTNPMTTDRAALLDKVARAANRMWCDFAFYVGATAGNADELGQLERTPGCCGVKVFMGSSTGNLLVSEDEVLRRVFSSGRRRVAIHAEDEARLIARKAQAFGDVRNHPVWRDAVTALTATRRAVALAREIGRKIHILHVSTAEEMEFLKDHKDIASVEVLPNHLTLEAPGCYEKLGALAQMNPPIRDARHKAALWKAVDQGIVDVLGSDHAPHTWEEKARPYPESPSGMPGVQTLLPLMLNHMNEGRLSLERIVDLTSAGPQRLFGLAAKGRLAVGYDADYTLVDLKERWTVTEDWLASRCGWSPFSGETLTGRPKGTIVRGRKVMWEAELLGAAHGQPMRFEETLAEA